MNGRKQVISCEEFLRDFQNLFYFNQQPILNAAIKDLQEEIIFRIHNKNLSGIRLKMIPGVMNCAMSFFEKNSSPKECTRLKNEAKKAAVFEGFFNFLFFASLPGNKALKPSGFCILNSLSFFEKPSAFF